MDWLFDNLGKFAPVVIFLLYMISSLKGKGNPEEEEVDPAAVERARKIQEEIRRKILERQRGDAGPTAQPPETIRFDEPEPVVASPRPVVVPPVARPVPQHLDELVGGRVDPYEERRQKLEAQLEEAKRLRLVAKEKATAIAKRAAPQVKHRKSISRGEIRTRLTEGLADRDSLKTAILLREVLDTPIGLR